MKANRPPAQIREDFESLDPPVQEDLIRVARLIRQAHALKLCEPGRAGFAQTRYILPEEVADELDLPLAIALDPDGKTWCNGELECRDGFPVTTDGSRVPGVKVELPSSEALVALLEVLAVTGTLTTWYRSQSNPNHAECFDLIPGTVTLNGPQIIQVELS